MTAKHYGIVAAVIVKLALAAFVVHALSARLHRSQLTAPLTDNQDSLKETQAL